MTADATADASERTALFNQGDGENGGGQVGHDGDFALGRDGPFGTDESAATY